MRNYLQKGLLGLLLWASLNPLNAQMLATARNPTQVQDARSATMVTLKSALAALEAKYNVSFLCKSNLVATRMVIDYQGQDLSSVEAELKSLLMPNGLRYEKVRDNFFVVLADFKEGQRSLPPMEARASAFSQSQATDLLLAKGTQLNKPAPKPQRLDFAVRGRVTSETGEGLPGVTVVVKGTTVGVSSGPGGNYALQVPDPNSILVFSFIGYVSQEVNVAGRQVINLQMGQDAKFIQEVVVVGYGTQERRELTGAISSVKSAEIARNINADPVTALQGNVPGVQLTQQGGVPGGNIRIRVRGNASMLSGGDPLVVVDGIPVLTSTFGMNPNDGISGLSQINQNDIESIEILKDASASAIYGSRAANGVILITTKRAKAGKSSFNLNYQQGVTSATNRVELLGGQELLDVNQRANQNRQRSGLAPANFFAVPRNVNNYQGFNAEVARNTNVDWLDQVLRQGQYRDIHMSGSTGSERTTVDGSAALRQEEGIEIGRSFTRGSGRLNAQHNASDRFKIGANLSLAYLENERPGANHFGLAQSSALPFFPIRQVENPNLYFNGYNIQDQQPGTNMFFIQDNYEDVVKTTRNINDVFLEFSPIKSLTLRTEWGVDMQVNANDIWRSRDLFPAQSINRAAEAGGLGQTQNRRFQSVAWNNNTTATFRKTFAEAHSFTALLGTSVLNQKSSGQTIIAENFPFEYISVMGTQAARIVPSASHFNFISGFSRFNYNFRQKYFLEASVRTDGSSRFGPGNRYGTFGGGALGWIISEENFVKNNLGFLSFLKLRASYGTVGNAELPNDFLYLSDANLNWADLQYGGFQGAGFNRIGNRDLRWESTTQGNIGLDYGFLNGRINGMIDVYDKVSDGLLLETQLANSTGYIERGYVVNVGKVRNSGIEFSINTVNLERGDFRWTSNFNISRNYNTTLALTPPVNAQDTRAKTLDAGSTRLIEGGVFGAYFLPIWAGVDPVTGNELIYEVDQVHLNQTGLTRLTGNVLDATLLGGGGANNHRMVIEDKSPHPTFFGGLSNTLAYKGLDFTFLFYFQAGNWILDEGERSQSYPGEQQSLRASVRAGVTADGSFSNFPLVYDSPLAGTNTTRFLHDGSFIRLRNLQLGYTLPTNWSGKIGSQNLRLYVAGQNLLTFTRFPGWDPEVFSAGGNTTRANLGPGITRYDLPQVRTILVGLNIGF